MEHGIGMGSSDQDYLSLDSIDSMNFLEMEEPVNDVTLDFQQSLPLENEKKEVRKENPAITQAKIVDEKPSINFNFQKKEKGEIQMSKVSNELEEEPTIIHLDSKDTQNMLYVDRRLMSFVEKRGPTEFKCKFCEHYSKKACHSREHIEMNHASGLVYPCVEPECSDVAFGARIELRRHKQRFHNKGVTAVKTEFKLEELVSSQKRGKSIK